MHVVVATSPSVSMNPIPSPWLLGTPWVPETANPVEVCPPMRSLLGLGSWWGCSGLAVVVSSASGAVSSSVSRCLRQPARPVGAAKHVAAGRGRADARSGPYHLAARPVTRAACRPLAWARVVVCRVSSASDAVGSSISRYRLQPARPVGAAKHVAAGRGRVDAQSALGFGPT